MKLKSFLKKSLCFFLSLLLILGGCLLCSPTSYAMTDEELRYWLGNSSGSWSVGQSAWFIMEMLKTNFGFAEAGNTFKLKTEMQLQSSYLYEQLTTLEGYEDYLTNIVSNLQTLNYNQNYSNSFIHNVGTYLGWKRDINDLNFSDSTITLRQGDKIYLGYYFNETFSNYVMDNGFYVVQVPFYSLNGMDISPELTGFYFKSYAGNPTNSRIIDESEIMNQPQYYGSALYLQNFSPYDVGSQYVYYFEFTVGQFGGSVYRSGAATPAPTISYAKPSELTFLSKLCLNVSEMNKNQMNIFNENYSLLKSIEDYLSNLPTESAAYQQAKQEQESVTNSVLDNFAGDGSAAASGSDVISMKDISGNIKNGLSTGANATAVFGVLTAPNVLWVWFSPENLLMINEPHSMPQQTRKAAPKYDNDVVDFYSENQQQLQDLLNFYNQGDSK